MPLVQVNLLEGRSSEEKEALLRAITEAVTRSIGAPVESIRVWIHEMPHGHFMVGGQLATKRLSSNDVPGEPR